MDLSFPWPMTQGEWLAFASAGATVLLGMHMLFAPGLSLKLLGLQVKPERARAIAEVRSTLAGFPLGLGLCCIVLAQPFLYMALGFCWLLAGFGRIVSILSDGAGSAVNWAVTVLALVLGALPLGFSLGMLP